MFGDGIRPPVKFFPMVPPSLVSGAEVTGNESKVVTERGKTFLLTVVNLLHNSIKLFGDNEEIYFDRTVFPGLELETPENVFQFLDYVGEDDHQVNWGDLSRADFDYNGVTDSGVNIESCLPYLLYMGCDSSSRTDYSAMWEQLKGRLSSGKSFWQDIQDATYPTTAEGRFAFLVGLMQTKRNWIYGMNGIGINPLDPNHSGAASDFEALFNSWKFQETGSLNMQILQNYVGMRLEVAARFNLISQTDLLNNNAVLQSIKGYYSSRAAGISLSGLQTKKNHYDNALLNLKALLDANKNLVGSVNDARTYASSIKVTLSSMGSIFDGLNDDFGLVWGDLKAARIEFNDLMSQYAALDPATITAGMNLGLLINKLDTISARLNSMYSSYGSMKFSPNSVIDAFMNELKGTVSTDGLNENYLGVIGQKYNNELGKPVGYVAALMGTNGLFKSFNKTNHARYERQKEEKMFDAVAENKLEAEHRARKKSEEKKLGERMASRVQQNNKAAKTSRSEKTSGSKKRRGT